MKTYKDWLNMGERRFEIRNQMKADLKILKEIYRENIEDTPQKTVSLFIEQVGKERATDLIATLINRHGWDGRISRRLIPWANNIKNSFDEEAALHMNIYCDDVIHLAHLDQIARAFVKEVS